MTAACHHAPVTHAPAGFARTPGPDVLAEYTRSGLVEGVHVGHAAVVDPDGRVVQSWGDPQHVIFPRSSNKPAQAVAMVECGLDVPDHLLALVSSSHSAEPFHLEGVRELLARAGLTEEALQTPADYPLDPVERDAWLLAGREPSAIGMNCSGKHAGMLATCVVNGWDTATYRAPDHPLQLAVRSTLERLAGEPVEQVGVDGCGAPVMSLTVAGLARSASQIVQAPERSGEARVARAIVGSPEWAGGTRRDVTRVMQSVPGLLAKDGAEGVYVAALRDGTGIAIKVEDGADRARRVVLAELLIGLGADPQALAWLRTVPVLGGGRPVGVVRAALG